VLSKELFAFYTNTVQVMWKPIRMLIKCVKDITQNFKTL